MTTDAKLNIALNIVWCAIGVFTGLAIADISSSEEGLFRWQTLMAGILAVAAAAATVFQMERTDERSQKRHEELVRLSLRSDRLKVERAAAATPQLRVYAKKVEEHVSAIEAAMEAYPNAPRTDFDGARALFQTIISLRALTTDDLVAGAAQLFGPQLTLTRGALLEHLGAFTSSDAQMIDDFLGKRVELAQENRDTAAKVLRHLIDAAKLTAKLADEMAKLLKELASEYR